MYDWNHNGEQDAFDTATDLDENKKLKEQLEKAYKLW